MRGGLAGPMMLMTARARRRPSTWFLPALGIALAVAFAGAVAAEGVIAGDQAARAALAQLTPLERTVRVTWQGALTTGIDRRAHALLDRLGLGVQTQVVLLNPVRLSGVIVRPAAISPLGRWIPAAPADRLGRCRAERCPVLLASGGRVPSTLAATGVRLRIAGTSPLRSAVPLAYETSSEGQWPLVLTGDTTGLDGLAGLSGVYRIHSWLAVLTVHNLHSWQLANVERRLADTQAALLSSGSQFSMSGPFDALDAARAQAGSAPSRLLLVGGGAAATLVLFVVLSAAALRREQLAELQRLRGAGACAGQLLAFAAGETALLSAVALLAGAALAIGATLALAGAAREPPAAVLAHSLLTPAAVLALAGCWAAAVLLITASVFTRAKSVFDVLAVAAIAALVAGMHAGTGAQGAGAASTLLLAPLCCLAAGVVVFRVAVLLLRAAERAARGGPVLARLALTGLARAPELPALSVAFLAVSVGLGGFALSYRATLIRGAADQAANQVPLDALVSASANFETPLQLAPVARWRELAPEGTVLPVRRTLASFASGDGYVTIPALGVPASGLTRVHGWREGDGSAPLATLARRLRPPGPVRTPGPSVPRGARILALASRSVGESLDVSADLRDPQGAITQLPLGSTGARSRDLHARLPPGHWEVQALELDEPAGLEVTDAHQNGENPAAATQSQTSLSVGPLLLLGAHGRALATLDLGAWGAVGAASAAAVPHGVQAATIRFQTTGAPGIVRPEQPSDTRPVPVLADPRTAAAAGPRGSLALTVDELPVSARVVGVIRRFPTIAASAAGFIVADEAVLSSALDAQLPGQGRPDELWIATPQPERLHAALRSGPLSALGVSFRADLQRRLDADPITLSVLGTLLSATLLSGALAVLGLLLALTGAVADHALHSDLRALGLGPRALRAELRARLALAGLLGVCAGIGIALLLTRYAVAAVGDAGTVVAPPPPPVTVVPVDTLTLWGLGTAVILALVGGLATIRPVT